MSWRMMNIKERKVIKIKIIKAINKKINKKDRYLLRTINIKNTIQ
jgi:hypothetical protein